MALVVIDAKDGDGNEVSHEQIARDWPALKAKHDEAMAKDPTWPAFGGVLTVEGREYQVVEQR